MVNKTRKQRKQRKQRKMRGGDVQQTDMSNIEPPGVKDNAKKVLDIGIQFGDNVAALGLEKLEDSVENFSRSIGIDPNKSVKGEITKWGKKAEEIQKALDTPEGRRAMQNASKLLSNISEDVIAPAIETGASQVIEHSGPIITKGQNALFDVISASPFGPLFDIPKLGADLLGVAENTAAMAADISGTTEETLGKLKDKENEVKGVWADLEKAVEKGSNGMNLGLSSGLDSIKNKVDNYGKEIVKNNSNTIDKLKNAQTEGVNYSKNLVNDGKNLVNNGKEMMNNSKTMNSLKNIHKEGVKIGGRINKAKLDFLAPRIYKTRMLKKRRQTNKWKTRKH
jgi:hypothetical protein